MGKLKRSAVAIGSVLFPAVAQAHPGTHGGDLAWSLIHIFGQSDYLLTVATVAIWASMFACVACWFFSWRGYSVCRRPTLLHLFQCHGD